MIIVDVYCGTKSFSKVAKGKGHKCFTIDINKKFNPDMCIDVLQINRKTIPKEYRNPDIMVFSPPCETFSLSGNSMFMGYPTNSRAYIGFALAYKCLELIREFKPKYWYIENPCAGMRSAWFMKSLEKTIVTYCQYGFKNMKPTDIFNNFGFVGRRCNNGDSCHESAPRGSRTGTQGEKSKEERGILPPKLCEEILDYIIFLEKQDGIE